MGITVEAQPSMAAELPDIDCGHAVSPTSDSDLGAKGAGEAGTCGAPAAVIDSRRRGVAEGRPPVVPHETRRMRTRGETQGPEVLARVNER